MNSISKSGPSPANSIASIVSFMDFGSSHVSIDSRHSTTGEYSRTPNAHPIKQDEQHSDNPKFFKRLVSSLATSQRQRHDHKVVARKHIALAVEFLQENPSDRKQMLSHLEKFVQHCSKRGLNIEHELNRALPSPKHLLTELLDSGDYDGLTILAPFLSSSKHGSTLVHRTLNNVYIGQGVKRQGSNGNFFSAEGRGLFLSKDGKTMGGDWRNNKPRGRMVTRSPDNGLVDFYHVPIENGQFHGAGVTKYRDGSTFSGVWVGGTCQGPGIFKAADGATLRGIWSRGKMQPGAQYESTDGRIYQGDFTILNNRPRGRATILWSREQKKGGFYDGCIEDGQPQGMGRYTFAAEENLSGFIYEGPWLNGRKHGSGILIKMVDGKRFNCAFIDDTVL